MSRAAMQQALEALEGFDHFRRIMTDGPDESDKVFAEDHAEVAFVTAARVIPALKQALSEPEQEPVAWMQEMPVSGNEERSVRMTTVKMVADEWGNPIPLYTAPTPRRPLTDEEIALIVAECSASAYRHDDFSFARAIERAHGIGEQHE